MPMKTAEKWDVIASNLLEDIRKWSIENGWEVSDRNSFEGMHTLDEEGFKADLWVHTPAGTVCLDVLRGGVAGAEGRIDLMDYPTLRRVMLVSKGAGMRIRTDSGIDWPNSWSKETYYDLVNRLISGE
jgi:hypothetical protein